MARAAARVTEHEIFLQEDRKIGSENWGFALPPASRQGSCEPNPQDGRLVFHSIRALRIISDFL
jgi:hypothetical protein